MLSHALKVLSKDYFMCMRKLDKSLNNRFTKLSSNISSVKAKLLDRNFKITKSEKM